jgi:hypothetical protein
MSVYDLSVDFGLTPEELNTFGYASTAPFWFMAVVRFKQIVTYDRYSRASFPNNDNSALVAEAGKTLIITDCLSLATHENKNSHVSNMTATVMVGDVNYLTEVLPGDWCMAWMLQSEDQAAKVIEKIKSGAPANEFMDGLKFVGKITGVRKVLEMSEGEKSVRYNIQGNGFTEFDAQFFYDPKLALGDPNIEQWLARLQIELQEFEKSLDDNNPGIDINVAIPSLVELLLGRGIPQQFGNPGDLPNSPSAGLSSTTNAPYAFIIPSTVGKLLGRNATAKPLLGYSDIFEAIYGVQKYQNAGISGNPQVQANNPKTIFLPDGANSDLQRRHTNTDMLGSFLPNIPQLQDTNVWTVLSQYLNPTINEMYTCLRVNNRNRIMPTFIVRQLPFSTSIYGAVPEKTVSQANGALDFADPLAVAISSISTVAPTTIPKQTVTEFLELPRWKAPPAIVYRFDIGRSNVLRFNFVYLAGQADPQKSDPSYTTIALLSNPPIRDDADIKRQGLRMSRSLVACDPKDVQIGPQKWMDIKADILMGQHLTLTGSIEMQGIQAPICVGDNFEFDSIVFHIESVAHVCVISGGRKYFHTTLQISNGVNITPDVSQPLSLYAGMTAADQRDLEPGLTTSVVPLDNSNLRAPSKVI